MAPLGGQELVKYTPESHEDYTPLTLAERKIGEVPFPSALNSLTAKLRPFPDLGSHVHQPRSKASGSA